MVVAGAQIVVGGKDEKMPLRILSLPRGWPAQLDLFQKMGTHPDPHGHSRHGAGRSLCVRAVAWKGGELLVGSADCTIYVADARTQRCKLAVRGHVGCAVGGLAMHPTKELLCTVGEDGQCKMWDTQQRVSAQSRHLRQPLTCVAFHPKDGRHVAIGTRSGELCVLHSVTFADAEGLDKDVSFGRCEQHSTYRRAPVHCLRYSPDARWLALAVGDGLIDIQDVESGYRHVRSVQGHWAGVVRLDWGAAGGGAGKAWRLQSSGEKGERRVWAVAEMGQDGDVSVEQVDPNMCRDDHWETWSLPVGWPVRGVSREMTEPAENEEERDRLGGCVGAVWHHGEVLLHGGGRSGGSALRLLRWPCFSTAARAKEYLGHAGPLSAIAVKARTGQGTALVASASSGDGGAIVLWKLVKSEKVWRGGEAGGEGGEEGGAGKREGVTARNLSPFVGLSHDFQRVCALTGDAEVTVFSADWDMGRGQAVTRHAAHKESVNGCCFSPASSKVLASASADRECHVWTASAPDEGDRAPDSTVTHTLAGHGKGVVACSFSPDGRRIATASLDRSVIVWDVSGGASKDLLSRGEGHRKPVLCVSWCDQGTRVASGSEDRTVRVWKVPSELDRSQGEVVLETEGRFRGHEEAVVFCAFAPP